MLSPDRILQACFGYQASQALLSAIELGLFTELGKGPRSVTQICHALSLSERVTGSQNGHRGNREPQRLGHPRETCP